MSLRALLPPAVAAVVIAVLALSLRTSAPVAPASAATATSVQSGAVTVPISNYLYKPMVLTVRAGTKVTFHNLDPTAHTATADAGAFDSGAIQTGATKSIVFAKAGTFTYHCAFHAFMKATIKVVK